RKLPAPRCCRRWPPPPLEMGAIVVPALRRCKREPSWPGGGPAMRRVGTGGGRRADLRTRSGASTWGNGRAREKRFGAQRAERRRPFRPVEPAEAPPAAPPQNV